MQHPMDQLIANIPNLSMDTRLPNLIDGILQTFAQHNENDDVPLDSRSQTVLQITDLTAPQANDLFQLGYDIPLDRLGIYTNALTASASLENWLDTIILLLQELSEEQRVYVVENSIDGTRLSLPPHPDMLAIQCLVAGIIVHCIYAADLVDRGLVECQLNNNLSLTKRALSFAPANVLLSLYFPSRALAQQLSNGNQRVYQVFARQLKVYQKGLKNSGNIEYKVLREVMHTTDWTRLAQSQVAANLAMSERTLVRRLQQEGLKFRDIVASARNAQALNLLFNGKPVAEVSSELGFSDRATFERSFKKWQGLSPAKIQAQYVLLASESDVESVINASELPHLPSTISRLLACLRQEETDIDQVIDLLETDPVLVAKVLRVANSSMYANVKADSLKQAVVAIFGFDKLYALTLSIVSTSMFSSLVKQFDYKQFWHRALLSAWMVERISETAGIDQQGQETLYLAGLLHCIGELVIHYCLPDKVAQYSSELSEQVTWREHNRYQHLLIGTHTTAVSYFVCHLWHIPKPVCDVIDSLSPMREEQHGVLNDALDVVDYVLFPTQQTQNSCRHILNKYFNSEIQQKRFLMDARQMRDDLVQTANDLL